MRAHGLLDEGDIVVHAVHAHLEDTPRRQRGVEQKGVPFVGMGVRGEGPFHTRWSGDRSEIAT